MSEDLGIQQNVDQKRGNYSGTGFVLGAAGGTYAGTKLAQKYQIGIPTKITADDLEKVFAQKPDFFDKKIAKDTSNVDFWTKAKEQVINIQGKIKEYNKALSEIKKENPAITTEELAKKLEEKGIKATAKEHAQSAFDTGKKELEPLIGKVKFVHNKWINGAAAALGLGIVLAGFGSLFHKNKS